MCSHSSIKTFDNSINNTSEIMSKPTVQELYDTTHSRLVAGESEQPKAFSSKEKSVLVVPNSFDADSHFYPKTINAQVSEIVSDFMVLGKSLL